MLYCIIYMCSYPQFRCPYIHTRTVIDGMTRDASLHCDISTWFWCVLEMPAHAINLFPTPYS